jgi:hypothetical protein
LDLNCETIASKIQPLSFFHPGENPEEDPSKPLNSLSAHGYWRRPMIEVLAGHWQKGA